MSKNEILNDIDPQETREWIDAINSVIALDGVERAQYLLKELIPKVGLNTAGLSPLNTPYLNTIPQNQEKEYPGDLAMEKKISNLVPLECLGYGTAS